MGILTWIALGLVAGAVAKLLMPGDDPGGIFITTGLGAVGAVVGGWIGQELGFGPVTGFNVKSLGLAIGGAFLLLLIYRQLRKKRS